MVPGTWYPVCGNLFLHIGALYSLYMLQADKGPAPKLHPWVHRAVQRRYTYDHATGIVVYWYHVYIYVLTCLVKKKVDTACHTAAALNLWHKIRGHRSPGISPLLVLVVAFADPSCSQAIGVVLLFSMAFRRRLVV